MHQDHFYEISETADGIFTIWEPAGVASTLIVGTKAALLVDTGYGFANLKETENRPLSPDETNLLYYELNYLKIRIE